jgi:hypothetical protein
VRAVATLHSAVVSKAAGRQSDAACWASVCGPEQRGRSTRGALVRRAASRPDWTEQLTPLVCRRRGGRSEAPAQPGRSCVTTATRAIAGAEGPATLLAWLRRLVWADMALPPPPPPPTAMNHRGVSILSVCSRRNKSAERQRQQQQRPQHLAGAFHIFIWISMGLRGTNGRDGSASRPQSEGPRSASARTCSVSARARRPPAGPLLFHID